MGRKKLTISPHRGPGTSTETPLWLVRKSSVLTKNRASVYVLQTYVANSDKFEREKTIFLLPKMNLL